ncbi:hypothetical protein L1887_47952 [Cichorium endivia]|nr:hypothetical protein L1887_47952 [Cichorium endivia]
MRFSYIVALTRLEPRDPSKVANPKISTASSAPIFPSFLNWLIVAMAWNLRLVVVCLAAFCSAHNNVTSRILTAANADNIDLYSLPITAEALASIESIYALDNLTISSAINNGSKFDVHTHAAPQWYQALVPSTGGAPDAGLDLRSTSEFHGLSGHQACRLVDHNSCFSCLPRLTD